MLIQVPSSLGAGDSASRAILIAVDFGTTFSGIAWAQSARPDVQTTIIQWPDAWGSLEAQTSEKVPTQLSFTNGDVQWGFGIPDEESRYQWFKLGLDPSQKNNEVSLLAVDYPEPKAMPPGYEGDPSPVDLTTEYLTQLNQHAQKILRRKLGNTIIDTTPLRYTITVPAMWSDAAKAKTRECAVQAGMGRDIHIVSEPEAAVVYALDALNPHDLKIGEDFVLCDAGGGTVDLISYTIVSLDPLRIRVSVPGSGSACGSIFLNRIFRKYLEDNLGDLEGFGEDTLEYAMNEFETVTKRRFTGEEDAVVIRVPGVADNAAKGVKRQKLTLPASLLTVLFKPVMAVITTLVKCQLQQPKNARAVILVGGFGQSVHLRNCIQQVAGDEVEIMQPPHGWTAVVRGALIKALHETAPDISRLSIASRKARGAYGVTALAEYDAAQHVGRFKKWNSYRGLHNVDIMTWMVSYDDELDEKKPVTSAFYRTQKVADGPFSKVSDSLCFFKPKGIEAAPKYPCEDVKTLAILSTDLSAIPHNRISQERGKDGYMYYVLHYQIKIAYFSAHIEFSLWYNGKQHGKVDAKYE